MSNILSESVILNGPSRAKIYITVDQSKGMMWKPNSKGVSLDIVLILRSFTNLCYNFTFLFKFQVCI
jgi:hypothetical protein